MFEKRHDVICCCAVAEAGRIGRPAGRATVTQSTPSQLSGASSAVRTSRNPTTQGSRVSISPQRSAPPAGHPARLRTLVSGATGDCFSAPFPTSISAARSGLAPPRELARGDERLIRRCMARAAIPHIRATHYAPSDAGRRASGHQSSCAPYRSSTAEGDTASPPNRRPAQSVCRDASGVRRPLREFQRVDENGNEP